MAFITADRVKDTSTTTGTGSITVSGAPPTGYRTFSAVLSAADTFYYCIQGQTTAEFEVGLGTYSSANVFARTTVLASSNSNSAVSFSAGIKNVFITLAATKTLQLNPSSSVTVPTVIGGTTASSSLTLQSTSGVGTTDSILFKVGNNGATTAMTVGTSGNVGIGTSSPSNALSVARSSGEAIISITNSGTTSSWLTLSPGSGGVGYIHNVGNTSTVFTTNGTERMRIDTSGNVGIGTSSPGTQLNVYKSTATQVAIRPQNSLAYADFGPISDGTVYGPYAAPAASTGLIVGTSNSNPVQIWTNGAERMRINSSGNVGIGTASPNNSLTVSRAGADVARFVNSGSNGGDWQLKIGGGGFEDRKFMVADRYSGADDARLAIDSNGNVGIGTSSPSASAILDAQSTTKGVRFPNMTTTQKNAISSPAAGLVVFDTTLAKLCVYSGSAWQTITSI